MTKSVAKIRVRSYNKVTNRKLTRSFGGYIRRRLREKCSILGIEFILVNSKGIGNVCSQCGAEGVRDRYNFRCKNCGYETMISQNAALNIEKNAIGVGI